MTEQVAEEPRILWPSLEDVLRHQARDGQIFDHTNKTVVVTQSLLNAAAIEIERLRFALVEIADQTLTEGDRLAIARKTLGWD